MGVSIMPARDETSRYIRDRPSKGITFKAIDSWKGEISDILEMGPKRTSI